MQKYVKNELIKEMKKTIREDENIIKNIIPFDMYTLQFITLILVKR